MAVMLLPADAVCAYRCAELAARHWGLVYIRTLRPDVPILYKPDEEFHIGGAKVLRQGGDLTLVGSCYTVHLALAAAAALAGEGIACGVVDCYSLPVADEALVALVRDPAQKILVLDDSYVGAVGSELAELAAAAHGARVVGMWVKETPKSARKPEEVLKQVGLGLEAVTAAARELARG
jgi:transketolase